MRHSFPLNTLDRIIAGEETIVFLDTARPTNEQRYSLLFKTPLRIYRCRTGAQVGRLLELISEESKNFWIAGYLAYEAAYWLEEKFLAQRLRRSGGDLVWFGIFDEPFVFDHNTGRWNHPIGTTPRHLLKKSLSPDIFYRIKKHEYTQALRTIRTFIAAGDVYQVNFTFDVSVSSPLQPWELYKELREKQPVPFGAFIKTPDMAIASFSPELFYLRQGKRIRVQPMKGTAPRGRFTKEDISIVQKLANDPKNRSENIMIVDLLRNDLGKICIPGSVATKHLFDIERHPTIYQMTSIVEGRLHDRVTFADTIQALFPSGSVTGAPKIRAMEIIDELEQGERGAYCGTIGYSSPEGRPAQRPAQRQVFSVPIRTLQRNAKNKQWRYRVGSGVVWDSSPEGEWQECAAKCGFLTKDRRHFRIFESLLFSKGIFFCLREHRARLFDSARYFDFAADGKTWDRTIRAIKKELRTSLGASFKIRILLDKNGRFSWNHEPIIAGEEHCKATAMVCGTPIDPDNPFLFHKTTFRQWYEKSMNDLRKNDCFDILHINTRGELTEGARSNVFMKINGTLYTPPVECGLLPGVLRSRLLSSGKCKERILFPKDLKKAEDLYCGNSVRGLVKVTIEKQ